MQRFSLRWTCFLVSLHMCCGAFAQVATGFPGAVAPANLIGAGPPRMADLRRCGPMARYEYVGLASPERMREAAGVYLVDPYQRGKIPVLLIHGWMAHPRHWLPIIEALRADPVLRERIQLWVVLYPTSYPLPETAAIIRAAIHEARRSLDPTHTDWALDNMVVIGKSTGGNLAKMLVQNSGTALWDAVFTRSFHQIVAPPATKNALASMFFYRAEPVIRRVVFVATTHGGSERARLIYSPIGWAFQHDDPMWQAHAELIAANGPDIFRPPFRIWSLETFDNMRTDSALLATLRRTPIDPRVPYHSIIGAVDHTVPLLEVNDRFADYAGAHIDGAASERIVPADHDDIESCPETIAEIKRILYLHLSGLGAPVGVLKVGGTFVHAG